MPITGSMLSADSMRLDYYRSLVAAMHEGVVVIGEDASILAANRRAEQILGLGEHQLQGRSLTGGWSCVREDGSPVPPDEYPSIRCLRTGRPVHDAVMGIRDPEGELRWVNFNAEPLIRDGEPRPYAVVTTLADISERHRLSLEHRALGRVSRAVIEERPPYEVFDLAAAEAARLVGAQAGGLSRFRDDGNVDIMGTFGPMNGIGPGTVRRPVPGGELDRVRETGAPLRVEDLDPASRSPLLAFGFTSGVVVPVRVARRVWGALGVFAAANVRLARSAERHLTEFADLLAGAIGNMEAREALVRRATSDGLTGLLNHRAFQERLRAEVQRGRRHGVALTLGLLDIDGFKGINDSAGHAAGDRLLGVVAEALREGTRTEDLVARLGGDEFALLMPETTGEGARHILDRVRAAIARGTAAVGLPVTVSAGACELGLAAGPDELMRLADAALYWSKAHGRDTCCVYDPSVMQELSAAQHDEALARAQALAAVRALARAIDAKDAATREHSERVAALAERLARAAGWPQARLARLREAALVHDVGKIGIADGVLLHPGALTAEQFEAVKAHAALGADIVADVLDAEQVRWVRSHHERPDGRGYPDGLAGDAISDGAELLALAEAFDAMTRPRPHVRPKTVAEALEECRAVAGAQFAPAALAALERVAPDLLATATATAPAP